MNLNQEFHGTDFQNRINFCVWVCHMIEQNSQFFYTVCFFDETIFQNNGLRVTVLRLMVQ